MITIRPTSGWVPIDVREVMRFKDLLYAFAGRDIKLRYKQTILGVAWVLLQPLLAAGFLYFAFGVVAGLKTPDRSYFLFTFAGLLAWNLFSATLSKTSLSMVGNAYLVSKVYFPRLILPLSGTLSTLMDFGMSLVLLLALFPFYNVQPGWPMVLLPVWIVLILLMALGAGLIATSFMVTYRDVQYILPVLIPFMLYASPVAYDVSRIDWQFQRAFYLINPLASLIVAFRWSLLGDTTPPPVLALVYSAVVAFGLFGLGAAIFTRTERRFADAI
jgi:lipopolysaccharide transport system permease protein